MKKYVFYTEIAFFLGLAFLALGTSLTVYVDSGISMVVEPAIVNAKSNAKKNDISNAEFYCDDASKYMINSAKKKQYFDGAFLDPPRNVCDQKFINA